MTISREQVVETLEKIADPRGGNIISSGAARAINVDGDIVRFVLEIDPAHSEAYRPVLATAEDALKALDGVEKVSCVMTAHQTSAPPDLKPAAKKAPQSPNNPQKIPGIAHVIAIASGKGGVGKSTVSANLACALAAKGKRVGLLDADVYGPSQPRMMGVSARPSSPDGKKINPLSAHGVTMISIGLMMAEGSATIWRGPMVMGALQQLLLQTQWGELDVLLIDLPPGTGDVQLTLAQKTEVDGAIIVSTPQDVALLDARKGINMFEKTGVPILGMIENMSTHICSNCGHEEHVFGHGGVAQEAEKLGVPLLAEVPLHLDIRVAADSGTPIVAANPDGPQAAAFSKVADALIAKGLA